MKHGFIKAAVATPKIRVADPAWNAEEICRVLQECYEQKAKLIVLPELCLTGATCGDLFLQERLLEEALEALHRVIACTKGKDSLVFAGLPLEKGAGIYSVAAVIQDGRLLAFIPKTHVGDNGEYEGGPRFAAGGGSLDYVDFDGVQVPFGSSILFSCTNVKGLTVGCELGGDVWAADTPSTELALAGATVLVNLSASNELTGKDGYRRKLLEMTSARLVAGYLYASAGEGESTQDMVFSGHNMILENGRLLAEARRFTNETVVSELDIARLRHERRRLCGFDKAGRAYLKISFTLQEEETGLTRRFAPLPFVPGEEKQLADVCEDILNMQAYGLKKRLEHTGCRAAVVGVSGGLDSTLTLLVTARAYDLLGLPRKSILAVTMPCFGTTDRTYQNACRMAETLGTTLKEVNIKEAVSVHFRDIGQDSSRHDVTYENSQARERTQVLMDMANQIGGMVIGTGDMSELALGWATYNGDHMSMYDVNGGVPKTLMRHLVRYYADTCADEALAAVLRDVLDTPVSPELLPPVDGVISQKTEDLVGPYELHDFFLYYLLRWGYSPAKIYRIAQKAFAGLYDAETILKWLKIFSRRFFTQQFKRSCLPDGPKVGTVGVSPRGDLLLPSDASMAAWQKELEQL